ncbi:GNAT family N-acetyltransferase [Chitinophaga solisilvae]|uniref:GNAT family N-acetyltransferase n=1 Tax=Chitinophaga solisilvae TaxID=1233460 RepID=A0A3S1BJZ8_9BACT|nr:GNAT family N-acetyltransferase [Chitinophaga solisilvae]NSL89167.1 GNAT family N-acetyltransferase [Chitinophaga solisilvae]
MITYRKAELRDIPAVTHLRLQFLKEVYPLADTSRDETLLEQLRLYMLQHLPEGNFVNWLAESKQEIIGTAGIVFYQQPPLYHNLSGKVGYILNVYTLPAFRRQGIARILMEKIMEEARLRQTGKLSLHASPDGRTLYEELGFIAGDNEMTYQPAIMIKNN